VHPGSRVPLVLRSSEPRLRELCERYASFVEFLVRSDGPPRIEEAGGARPRGSVLTMAGDVEVLIGLLGLVESGKELERVERRQKKLAKDLEALDKRLENPKFSENAPAEVVADARGQRDALARELARLEEARALAAELE
jgi:valyl-tRNA synthetase